MINNKKQLIEEKGALDDKIRKLSDFFTTNFYKDSTKEQRVLLCSQYHFMAEYSRVLLKRIETMK